MRGKEVHAMSLQTGGIVISAFMGMKLANTLLNVKECITYN